LSKLRSVLRTIDSEYCVICGDDDFIVPNAMDRCVEFLEINPDYAVAHGHLRSVFPLELKKRYRTRLWTCQRAQRTIDSPWPRIRLEEHLSSCEATFYSVHRRSQLTAIIEAAVSKTRDHVLGELLPTCLTAIRGKVKRLDVLYGVRPYNPQSISSRTKLSWPTLLTANDFSSFRDCLVEELVRVANISAEESISIANGAFIVYLSDSLCSMRRYLVRQRSSSLERKAQYAWKMMRALRATAGSAFLRGAAARTHSLSSRIRSPASP